MIRIEYTPAQAAQIAAKWNNAAAQDFQITPDMAWTVIDGDYFADEIAEYGEAEIEVPSQKSASGRPAFILITRDDLTITELHDDA